MDFLALANSSIDFALYCAMSRKFRIEFQKLLGVEILKNWIPLVENFAGTSYIVTQVIKYFSENINWNEGTSEVINAVAFCRCNAFVTVESSSFI